jgi:putative DNA primase/helicase
MPAPMMIPLSAIDALLALGIAAVIPPGDRAFLHALRDRPHLDDGTVEATIEELGVFGRLRRDYGPKSNGHAPEGNGFALPEEEDDAPPNEPVLIATSAPYDTAKLFLGHLFTAENTRTLHHHKGGFYCWSGTAFAALGDEAVRAGLYQFLDSCETAGRKNSGTKPVKPTRSLVGNVADALRAAAYLDDAVSPPAWLDHVPDIPAEEIVACANGLLRLPTLDLLPHTPAFYNHNALDFAFEPQAPEPRHWLEFLRQLWPEDPASIETLQEIFGLCLTGDTNQQKAFLIVGPKRSGKGTIARILTQLIGAANVVAPTLAGLGANFGLSPLIGKRVGIISDARLGGRADQQVIAERLLSITGEDALTIDRKFLAAWTGRLQVRFVILSNELPRLADASGALTSRFIVLMLTNSFYGREDHTLTGRLLTELPGILNWSIAGWRRLSQRGYFHQPPSAAEAVRTLEDLGSPIGAFIRDRLYVGPGRSVSITRLFEVWCEWCKEQGRDKPGTAQTFGRDLRAAVPGLKVSQSREYGDRLRLYEGIGLQ